MSHSEQAEEHQTWMWLVLAAGAALAAFAVAYYLQRNPSYRLDHLLRRCETRIHNLESSLAELESTLAPSRS